MRITQFHVSGSAVRQMAQRNLSPEDILAVLTFGCAYYVAGVTVFFLRWRDLSGGLERKLERLVGTSVAVAGNRILAAYRNPKVIAEIKRGSKPLIGY